MAYVVPSPGGSGLLSDGQIIDFGSWPGTGRHSPGNAAFPTASSGPSCWLPDGSAVVIAPDYAEDSTEQTYSATTGKETAPDMATPAGPVSAVTCSASTSDPWVAAGDDQGNVILRLAGGTVVPLPGHSASITSIASSPDGRYLATASLDGTAQIWNAATAKLVTTLGAAGSAELTGVQFASDNRRVLTVDDQGFVRVWDAGIGKPVTDLEPPAHGAAVPLGFTSSGQPGLRHRRGHVDGNERRDYLGRRALLGHADRSATRSIPLPGITTVAMPCSAAEDLGIAIATRSPPACHVPPPPRLAQPSWSPRPTRPRRRPDRTWRWRRARMANMSLMLARTRSRWWTPAGSRSPPCR